MVREVLVSRTEPSNVPSEIAVPEQPLYFYFKISPSFGLGYGPETSVPMAVHRHARAHPTRRRPFPTTDSRPDRCGRERSEEHTSELQSRLHLVCRLLLEKKKNKDQ